MDIKSKGKINQERDIIHIQDITKMGTASMERIQKTWKGYYQTTRKTKETNAFG